MARQRTVVTVVTDDSTGDVLSDGEVQTVSFAVDGTSYEIDLSPTHASSLRHDLGRWVAHARTVAATEIPPMGTATTPSWSRSTGRGGFRWAGRTNADRDRAARIRQWAVDTGYVLFERGRIPAAIVRAYDNQPPPPLAAPADVKGVSALGLSAGISGWSA